jgi:hypothetical protein
MGSKNRRIFTLIEYDGKSELLLFGLPPLDREPYLYFRRMSHSSIRDDPDEWLAFCKRFVLDNPIKEQYRQHWINLLGVDLYSG